MPVAHGEGCYFADDATLRDLETHDQVLLRYVDAKTGAARRRRQSQRLAAPTSPASATASATSSA